tara:strand:- start:234 stop:1019 length:786 start_codon:yes stop_codon:yes gene_type:complete
MGLYLGATQIQSGAAAAAAGLGQTITVGDYAYPNARPINDWLKTNYNSVTYNGNASGGGTRALIAPSNQPVNEGSYVLALTQGSYGTVVDITGAANGGALINAGVWKYDSQRSANNQPTLTYRFTIDGGTPVVLGPFVNPTTNEVGSFISAIGYWDISSEGFENNVTVQLNNKGASPFAQGISNTSPAYSYSGVVDATTGVNYNTINTGSNFAALYASRTLNDYLFSGFPYVYFATSCKVEVLINYSFTQGYKAVANVKTF